MRLIALLVLVAGLTTGCTTPQESPDSPGSQSNREVVPVTEVQWSPLNPARGDKSPRAGTLWGNRSESGPTGFLVQFVDGFSSPPHIHNVSYRGVVLSGRIHNDDPDAAAMWMPTSSFWTQPAGEVHITAAKGSRNVAYIEIEDGPYLVMPEDKALDNGERPINVHASNLVWIDWPGTASANNGPKVAYLWGNRQSGKLNGTLVRFPRGYDGSITVQGSSFRAVVIQGQLEYQMTGPTVSRSLPPGSYFGSSGETSHKFSCDASDECVIYIRTDGPFEIIRTRSKN